MAERHAGDGQPVSAVGQTQDIVAESEAPATSRRILAFDLIRGFLLIMIMIDHVELYPSGWDLLTGRGRLFVSAAEGFFFLSGMLIGMMYRRRLHLGMKFIFRKMWRRAVELYVAGTSMTLLFLCWVEFTHHAPIKDALPSPFPWHHDLIQILLMRFTYGWADFLVRFAILMLIAPFVFWLIAKTRWWLALAVIILTWTLRGQGFTLAWQLIFNGGMIVGFNWQAIEDYLRGLKSATKRWLKRSLAVVAVATFGLSYASVYLLSALNEHYQSLTPWLRHLTFTWNSYNADIWIYTQKWTMGPLRVVLFLIWASALFFFVRRYERTIGRLSRGVLELLGRNSLFVYVTHSIIIFVLKMYFIPPKTSLLQAFLITTVALALLVAVVKLYQSQREKLKHFRMSLVKVWS